MIRDDLGAPFPAGHRSARVVSLVPSLTETVAVTAPERLVGATKYCSHPESLDVPRVGGTKWPMVDEILALRPDTVLANVEENRREDVEALRAAGIAVWVTYPRTVEGALDSLGRMLTAIGVDRPTWLDQAAHVWADPPRLRAARVVVPVWRKPWVVIGPDTFATDVLARLGLANAYADAAERYPRPKLEEVLARQPELVVLPDEPYVFTADDGPEAFPGVPWALVSGRHLTWYGPSLVEARDVLERQVAAADR
jgi:ABC-type hemin transport system substrate-binding protein